MRRFLLVVALLAVAFGVPATAALAATCATAAEATYRHTFTGPAGAATIAAVVPLCADQNQMFSLASYTVGTGSAFLYDVDHAVVDADHRSVTLDVAVPRCATQVDAVFGSDVPAEAAGFGTVRLGSASGTGHRSAGVRAWYTGGDGACAPQPSVTFASDCDGGFTAALANRAGAAVTAIFLVGDQMYRVAAGTRTTVVGDAGGSLTVRDNTFQTTTGTWSMPATCTQPAPPTTTAPTVPPPTTAPASATPARSVAPPPATASPAGTLDVADGTTFEPSAAVTIESAPTTVDVAAASSSTGSAAWIALGVLLIGGGVAILGRQIHRARQAR